MESSVDRLFLLRHKSEKVNTPRGEKINSKWTDLITFHKQSECIAVRMFFGKRTGLQEVQKVDFAFMCLVALNITLKWKKVRLWMTKLFLALSLQLDVLHVHVKTVQDCSIWLTQIHRYIFLDHGTAMHNFQRQNFSELPSPNVCRYESMFYRFYPCICFYPQI